MTVASAPQLDPPAFRWFRAIVCGATLIMVVGSWPLWAGPQVLPRVPFLRGLPRLPVAWILVPALGMAMTGLAWRTGLGVAFGLIFYAVARDQNALQPWAYQFALFALIMILARPIRALALARVLIVSLYLFSGLSKLDVSFVAETGSALLDAGSRLAGFDSSRWPGWARTCLILAMPTWEIAVGLGLLRTATRRIALAGALGQHLALIALLGPWSLDHSANVLIWNAAMIAEDLSIWARPIESGPLHNESIGSWVATVITAGAVMLPLGEPWGWFDIWPSHALYASHGERVEILVHEDEVSHLGSTVPLRSGGSDVGGWRKVDLTGWSRRTRGTPLYPQNRVSLALAGFLAKADGVIHPIRVIEWSRAGRFSGRRDRLESVGSRAIYRRSLEFRFGSMSEMD